MNKSPDHVQVTEDNIQAIYDHEKHEQENQTVVEKIACRVAAFAGTVDFIVWHVCIFATWIVVNLIWEFDPFPFILLITVVSLEAILLTSFVLLSQNKATAAAERQSKLDLQINLLAERESTALLRVVTLMAKKMGIEDKDLKEAESLSDDTNPTDVLEKIVEKEKEESK